MQEKSRALPLWHEDRLLFAVILATSILSSWLWWVPIRCIMDGPAFEWSNSFGRGRISGAGMDGDFLVLLLLAVFFISIIYMGWRGAKSPFKALLIIWCAISFANSAILTIDNPGGYRFRGDTMGIDINLAWFMPALKGAVLLGAIAWVIRDLRALRLRTIPDWNRRNTRFLAVVLAIVPVQFIMLRFGPMHDITDKIGWMLTYTEWILVNLALLPWSRPKAGKTPETRSSNPLTQSVT